VAGAICCASRVAGGPSRRFLVTAYGERSAVSLAASIFLCSFPRGKHFPCGKLPDPGTWVLDQGSSTWYPVLGPGTSYHVHGTRYLVPSTWYQVLGTKYLVPGTWYQVLGTKYLVPSTWYQVLGTKHVVPGTWYQVLGTRYLAPGAYFVTMIPSTWYQGPGTWGLLLAVGGKLR
jgi:hypothetical protein